MLTTSSRGNNVIEAAHSVILQRRHIGTLLQRGDVARFVFDDDYWDFPDRPILGLWFEDNPRQSPQAALRLPPWFSNLLPEGQLREWIARDRGVSADRELQLLLQIGHDLPGAVQIVADTGSKNELASLTLAEPRSDSSDIDSSPWKFSLAGVGLKFSMLRDGDRLTIPSWNQVGDWIVKFPSTGFPNVPLNEFGTMRIAASVGIDVPVVELVHRDQLPALPDALWPNGEQMAYAVKRFDRDTRRERIHIEDFAQVRGWYSEAKYSGTLETVVALSYRGRDRRALREAVRRVTFNLLIGNGDAHLKNWSIIYPDGRVPTLSPAYDLVSTGAYYRGSQPDDLGLKFGNTRDFKRVGRAAFVRLQQRLGVTSEDVLDVVDTTIESFFSTGSMQNHKLLPPDVARWVYNHAGTVRRQIGQ